MYYFEFPANQAILKFPPKKVDARAISWQLLSIALYIAL